MATLRCFDAGSIRFPLIFSTFDDMKPQRLLNILLLISLSFLLLPSCKYSKEPKQFKLDHLSLSYPSFLQQAKDVYPSAQTIFQAKNGYRDVYFILVDWGNNPGDSMYDLMSDSVVNQLKANLNEVNIEKSDSSFTINNMKARESQLSGILSQHGMDIRFLFDLVIFQTKDGHIYQTAGWLMRHKQNLWLKDLQKAAYSFKSQ